MPKSARKLSSPPVACKVMLVREADWALSRARLSPAAQTYADALKFAPKLGRILCVPAADGRLEAVLLGIGDDLGLKENPFLLAKLATDLPAGNYSIDDELANPTLSFTGFLMGSYRFDRFKSIAREDVKLVCPEGANEKKAQITASAIANGRDLINRPANDLTTNDLAAEAKALAARHGAKFREIIGDALLEQGFPLIHAVGRASANPPRLVEFTWGNPKHDKVTLVGKGVVFDTGGLNLKPDNSMLLMKKDMGGAAAALSAAEMIMATGVKVRLRVILPIVENSVAGASFRPGDIIRSRKGITVEIGNTDAEGRLILADALAYADEEMPDLLIDFATLTGAARVALGPDLPPFFTNSEELARAIERAGSDVHDSVWRLPLWKPYRIMLDSKAADMNNVSSGGFAGSITAALFLKQFVEKTKAYAHFDIYGWSPSAKPGRPEGGDPQAARLIAHLVEQLDH